ncbi:AAA family ATPase [Pseudomonas sp. PLMAX]|uniref:AAA family ATPase n=1 Tax=Pseudomonas sp. PLMAX TaxID=2201998 RepID=UPI0038BCC075
MSPFMKRALKALAVGLLVGTIGLAGNEAWKYYNPVVDPADQTVASYDIRPADELFLMKGKALDNVSQIVVVAGSLFNEKQILIKSSDSSRVLFYPALSYEAYNQYQELVLKQLIGSKPDIDYRVTGSLSGVGKMLGIPYDPVGEIAKQTAKSAGDALMPIVSMILIFVIVFTIIISLQGNSLSNKMEKTDPKDIKDDLDDLVGMKDIVQEVLQLEEMLRNKKLFAEFGIDKPQNLMFTGPAGCGKTMLARCLAKRLNLNLYYGSGAGLESGYVGGGPKTLKRLYKKALRHKEGAIIFLDEAEDLLKARNSPDRRRHENDTSNTFLSLLDGVAKDTKVIWIVASNFSEQTASMDPAMMRRFPHKINFRLPNQAERLELLKRLIEKRAPSKVDIDINLNHLATISAGMSPATLDTLISRASLIAIQEKSLISQDRLVRAFERVAVGLTDRATTEGMEEDRRIISVHEAGHFIMRLHNTLLKIKGDLTKLPERLDTIKISTEAVSQHNALGFVLSKNKDKPLSSRDEYEDTLTELYGGVANEEVTFGEASVTAGARDDIAKATSLLDTMYNEVGYYSNAKLNLKVLGKAGTDVGQARLEEIKDSSVTLYLHCKNVLTGYVDLTQIIADSLMDNYVLTHSELITIIGKYFDEKPDSLAIYHGRDLFEEALA